MDKPKTTEFYVLSSIVRDMTFQWCHNNVIYNCIWQNIYKQVFAITRNTHKCICCLHTYAIVMYSNPTVFNTLSLVPGTVSFVLAISGILLL